VSAAVLLFLARALLLLLLYLFLYLVVQALRQDLRTATRNAARDTRAEGRATPQGAGPLGPGIAALQLQLIDAGHTPLQPGQRYSLRDPVLIGRSARSDITLEDDWVSAEHLRLRRLQGAWLAEDLGSTNGTRLNGRPLKGAARVRAGDVLDLGRVKLTLVEQG
jgi:pSer/pThr/pTyr-binding forkhead associated (FHA) protein